MGVVLQAATKPKGLTWMRGAKGMRRGHSKAQIRSQGAVASLASQAARVSAVHCGLQADQSCSEYVLLCTAAFSWLKLIWISPWPKSNGYLLRLHSSGCGHTQSVRVSTRVELITRTRLT